MGTWTEIGGVGSRALGIRFSYLYPTFLFLHMVSEHMAAAKRVLRYSCSTSGMGLVLGGRRPVVLTGHADASWADDQATQRSSQGYTFSLCWRRIGPAVGFFAAALDTPGDLQREVRDRGTGCMTCSLRCGRSDVGTRDYGFPTCTQHSRFFTQPANTAGRRCANAAAERPSSVAPQKTAVRTLAGYQPKVAFAIATSTTFACLRRTRRAGYPVDHRVPLVDHQVPLVDHSSRRATPLVDGPLPSTRTVSCCRRAPLVDRCSLIRSTDYSVDLPVELPLLVDCLAVAQTSQLQLSSSLVDSNTTTVPCSSTKPVEQLSHCEQSVATPVHPTKSSALPKRGRGQHSTPVNKCVYIAETSSPQVHLQGKVVFDAGQGHPAIFSWRAVLPANKELDTLDACRVANPMAHNPFGLNDRLRCRASH
ncbi:unnamed protein product [Closterium sp. NIES-54]